MSAPSAGKRPLSDIAREAEANVRASKRKAFSKRASPRPFSLAAAPFNRGETMYKILCPASKTGSIIGKGGGIIESIRQDTGAMIRVEDAVYGCDERVVTVSAKEDSFRPQKFRGPGNYRKNAGDVKGDYISDTDKESEKPHETLEQGALALEEKAEDENQKQEAEKDQETKLLEEEDMDQETKLLEEEEKDQEKKLTEEEDKDQETKLTEEGVEKAVEAVEEKAAETIDENLTEEAEEKTEQAAEEETKDMALEPDDVKTSGNENSKDEVLNLPTSLGLDVNDNGLSPVQEALLRVHLRILEADLSKPEENHAREEILTRLLVPTSQVGCLLGKQGKIVAQMREKSGAQIRILPKDQLPLCASLADELVQIAGDSTAVRKALLAVSTQLRNNPPKKYGEELSLGLSKVPLAADFPRKGGPVPGRPKKAVLGRARSSRLPLGPTAGLSLPHGQEEVTYRIICPKEKIGSIIGKGGSIVQSIREETGAKISIDVSSDVGDERVIRVSAPESPDDVFSKAQKATIIIHSKISAADPDKDGLVTTKLLVPADQAGCLLGKGGSIVTEMRRVTRSKIHIYGKEHLPPYALKTDQMVEVVGNLHASQEALMQITSRLRDNLFNEKLGPGYKEAQPHSYSGLTSPIEGPMSLRSPMMPMATPYERYGNPHSDSLTGSKGQQSYGPWAQQPVQSHAQDVRGSVYPEYLGLGSTREPAGEAKRPSTAFITSQTVEVVVPEHAISSIVGDSGGNLQQICKISGARVNVKGLTPGALERIVDISGTPDQTHAAQSLLQAFILSGQ